MAVPSKVNVVGSIQSQENEKEIVPRKIINKRKVGYAHSKNLIAECDRIPNLIGRASMVHCLIESYCLLKNVISIKCDKVDTNVLNGFHSADYLDFIEGNIQEEDDNDEYGIGYDCPPLEGLYSFVETIAGGSVSAARALVSGVVDVAVNFSGGWHHAQRDKASGFCYVNDCVLAILELEKKFKRVLYIDLDIHHGDGVENAFIFSKKVFTLSIHKYEEGYFPGTGALTDVGLGSGRYYSCNVPLLDGASDETFVEVFANVFNEVIRRFQPEAIVCQCGADGLAGDPLGTFNLTPAAYTRCLTILLGLHLPTLVLGGGGYHKPNAARCFASILACILDVQLDSDIPEHEFFEKYGPSFELEVTRSHRKDENSPDYIKDISHKISSKM